MRETYSRQFGMDRYVWPAGQFRARSGEYFYYIRSPKTGRMMVVKNTPGLSKTVGLMFGTCAAAQSTEQRGLGVFTGDQLRAFKAAAEAQQARFAITQSH